MSTFLSNQEWRWCSSLCPVLAILLDDHDGSIRWFLQGTSVLGGEMWGRPQNSGRYPALKGLCWEATVSWKFTLYMLEFLDFLPSKTLLFRCWISSVKYLCPVPPFLLLPPSHFLFNGKPRMLFYRLWNYPTLILTLLGFMSAENHLTSKFQVSVL